MPLAIEQLIKDVKEMNVLNAAVVNVTDINFSDEVRKYCEKNSCGKCGTNWACPPGVGPVAELKRKAHEYEKGIILQTVHQIANSFDLKGMMAGGKVHEQVLRAVLPLLKEKYDFSKTLVLGAGPCTICEICSYEEGQPCRFPDKALSSLEAYGIDVVSSVKRCNIPYNNGPGTVSYIGLILFNRN